MVTSTTTEPLQLGQYRIIRRLDQGASGFVYEGWNPETDRRVALKTVDPSRMMGQEGVRLRERLHYEAQIFERLAHPNIVTLYEYHGDLDLPFLVLELLEGQTLRARLKADPRLPWRESVALLSHILDAATHIHANGVIHLDLKPANIILLADNRVKVTDFGIAQRLDAPDPWQTITGTPGHMSPEQWMGHRLDPRSDLFSMGIILYQLLTGVKPFLGKETPDIMQRVLNHTPKPPSLLQPHLPTALDAVVHQALAKQPADRFQSAELFQLALQRAADSV